jgi:hypothetical protein
MKIDSLKDLESAFAEWRQGKKHAREPTPDELLARARRAVEKHGLKAVVAATRVERARLFRNVAGGGAGPETFSRLELGGGSGPNARPLAEVETGTGVRLRVFEQTPEMLKLLSVACGFGGVR